MKRNHCTFLVLFLSVLLLAGCNEKAASPEVYYPSLSHSFLKQNLSSTASYTTDAVKLYYNGEVYTLSQHYQEYSKQALPLDTLLGKELCPVYGNRTIHWSDVEEELADCTHTGTLYQVTGYDKNFRVCLYFEVPAQVNMNRGPLYNLYVLDRTNNITLRTGKDYYTNLYHFPTDASLDGLAPEDPAVSAFIDALLDAEFIHPADEALPDFNLSSDTTYFFSFTDNLGLSNAVAIYENGYVVDPEDYNFILKLDPALCTALIDKFHQPEWPGIYRYVTYSYDNDRDIRTELKYELTVTETSTDFLFDLCVTRTEVPLHLSGSAIDTSVVVGPADTFSVSKEEASEKHLLSFVSQKVPDRPDLITYVELKKGLQEDVIFLRYANSEGETEQQEYVILKKQ